MQEITGQVTLCDDNDSEVYLPSWITTRRAYQQYCHELGYEAKVKNTGNVEVIWVGDPEKEPLKKNVIVSWGEFVKYRKDNHNFLVVSDPNRDICNQCHVFANRHKYNISNKDLFFLELERERERDPKDTITQNTMQQCEPENEALEEVMISSKNHIPAGDKEVQMYEEMINWALRHVNNARAQRLLYKSLVLKAR